MKIGTKNFDIGSRTYIIGILNVTPDSFSDGGNFTTVQLAVQHAKELQAEGADIIEVGGESTRPGHNNVDPNTEIERVVPVIKELVKAIDTPIAVDTSKAEVARAALEAGASLVNDIWGFKKDPNLAKVCAEFDTTVCLMHNRTNTDYNNFLVDVVNDINESISILLQAGVDKNKIIIDPGVGFAKSVEQNVEVLRNLSMFTSMPYPVMLGTSKKSFMGKTIGLELTERNEATIATTVLGINNHCAFVRVHNVAENKKAAMMADYIVRRRF